MKSGSGIVALLRIFYWSLLSLAAFAGGFYFAARDNFGVVIPDQIYRSAQLDGAQLREVIRQRGIRSIINLSGAQPGKSWYEEERAAAAQLGVTLHDLRFSAIGLPPVFRLFKLKQLLETTDLPVLIHCRGGTDRTGMASVLALILDGESDMEYLQEQISFKYFNFHPQSTGRLWLEQYTDWLAKTGAIHNAKTFIYWMDNAYMDANGNLLFYIDQINRTAWKTGTRYEDGFEYRIDRDVSPELEVSGWAIDVHNQSLVKQVDVYLGDRRLGTVEYGYAYVGVASYFGDDRYVDSGWMLRKSVQDWQPGCHDLSLRIIRLDSTVWHSLPQARVCLGNL